MSLADRLPAVLREEPQFRRLFLGQALSLLGDRITFVALPFAVLGVGGSAAAVGLVVAAQTVPFALFTLAAGVWADRLERRAIMIASDTVRLVCQALAGTLLLAGVAEPWMLGAIAFVYGTADAFFVPAMTGLLPQTVAPRHLQSANALRSLTMSSSMVVGPAAAGVLIALAGPGGALLADSATFAVSVAFLLRLRPAVVASQVVPEPDFLSGLRGGWREVRSRAWVGAFLAATSVYHLIMLPAVFVLGPVLADRELGGAESWAVITAAFGAGAVAGNLVLLRWRPARPLLVAVGLLTVASCQAAIFGSGLPVAGIAALEALAGVAITCSYTLWETSLGEHIPGHALSRVSSYDYFITVGLMPLGVAAAGPVADAVGLQPTLLAMSAIAVATALACLTVPGVRELRRAA